MNFKSAWFIPLLVSALAVPAVGFAQSQTGLTRAQVQGELAQLRQAGYRGDTETSYPAEIEAAQQRVAAAAAGSYGAATSGASAEGAAAK